MGCARTVHLRVYAYIYNARRKCGPAAVAVAELMVCCEEKKRERERRVFVGQNERERKRARLYCSG